MEQPAFQTFCRSHVERMEGVLGRLLPSEDILPARLHRAMRYSVLGGGKRIRPLLVYATGHCLGVAVEHLDRPAAALELIHAYSLVHDDLPARIAVASSKARWQVGRPRRRSSLSMAGRSSWTRE